jgi:acyl carrier protein
MEKKVKAIMASVFEIDEKEINEESSSETIDTWDSMMHMNLIAALEEEFEVEFDEEEIIEMMDYRSILEVLSKQLS